MLKKILGSILFLTILVSSLEARTLAPKPKDTTKQTNTSTKDTDSISNVLAIRNIIKSNNIVSLHKTLNNQQFLNNIEANIKSISSNNSISFLQQNLKNIENLSFFIYINSLFWKEGTVFITDTFHQQEQFIVAKTTSNKFIIAPNNGSISFINLYDKIIEIKIIDKNHYNNVPSIYYQYVPYIIAGKLANNPNFFNTHLSSFANLDGLILLEIPTPTINEQSISGNFLFQNISLSSLISNINKDYLSTLKLKNNDKLLVSLKYNEQILYKKEVAFKSNINNININESAITLVGDINNSFLAFYNIENIISEININNNEETPNNFANFDLYNQILENLHIIIEKI